MAFLKSFLSLVFKYQKLNIGFIYRYLETNKNEHINFSQNIQVP